MPNQTGKRFVCASCGTEMLVTRGGDGVLACCGQLMQPRTSASGAEPQAAQQETQRG